MTNLTFRPTAWLIASASLLLLGGIGYFFLAKSSNLPLAGNTDGDFSVQSDGSAQYSITLVVPPGINGLAPQLSLSYSTNSGNGILGVDVQLGGLSAISRVGATPAQDGFRGGVNYDSLDRFSLDGSRLMTISTLPYGQIGSEYHTEIESYTKVLAKGDCGSGPCSFLVWEKNGVQKEYGTVTNAQVVAVGDTFQSGEKKGSITRWLLNKITDNNGNTLTISYQKGVGVSYPKTIAYTANDTAPARRKVHFFYENRLDTAPSYQGGAISQTLLRLTAIRTYTFTTANDSTLIKEYDLRYEANTPLHTSRLQTLTEKTATGDSLPPIGFQWSNGPNTLLPAQPIVWSGLQNNEGYTGDFNGDGKTDIFASSTSTVYLATDNGFDDGTSTMIPFPAGSLVNTADFNGDGLADLFIGLGTQGKIYYSDNGIFSNSNYINVSNLSIPTSLTNVGMGDFNGDGLPDIFSYIQNTGYLSLGNLKKGLLPAFPIPHLDVNQGVNFYADFNADGRTDILSCGNGGALLFLANTNLKKPFQSPISINDFQMSISAAQNWVSDYNGDGAADLLTYDVTTQGYYLYYATGMGFSKGKPITNLNLQQPAIYPSDYNGDGLMDIYVANNDGGTLYRSNGIDFSDTTQLNLNFQPQYSYLGDFNGDGVTDLFSTFDKSISYSGNTQHPTATTNQAMNLLVGITNGIKGDITLCFQPITNSTIYQKGASTPEQGVELLHISSNFAATPLANVQVATCPVISVQNPLYVVSAYWQQDGRGANYAYSYRYANAKYDMEGYGFLGFSQQWAYDSSSQAYTYTHFLQNFPLTGNTDTTRDYSFQNQPLSYSFTRYKTYSQPLPDSLPAVFVVNTFSQTVQNFNQGENTPAYSTFLFYQYDSLGNVTLRADYGNVAANRRIYTINTFSNSDSNGIQSYLTQTTIASDSLGKNILSQTRITYDPKGNPQIESLWDNQENCFQKTTYGYDKYGNNTFVVNPAGDTAYTQYDSLYHSFPVSQTSPPNAQGLRLTSYCQYEAGFGNLLQTTDPNHMTSYNVYDGLGRLIETKIPDNTGNPFTTTQMFFLRDSVGYVKGSIISRDWNGAKTDTSYSYLDGLGRNYLGMHRGFGGQTLWIKGVFNSQNKLIHQTRPYATGETPVISSIYYNANNHPYRIVHPFGNGDSTVTLMTYQGMKISILQAANTSDSIRSWAQYDIYNGRRHPVSFVNPLQQTTTYQYDILGRLTQANDPQNISTSCAWNSLGENIWVYSPASDTTFYQTIDSLRLSWVISPNGDTLVTRQDALGRCISQKQSPTDSISFLYDLATAKNGLGKLCKITQNQNISFSFAYNNQGSASQKISQIAGKTFVENVAFNPDQTPEGYTYPDSTRLAYTYSAQGLIENIGLQLGSSASIQSIVNFQTYSNDARPVQYQFGNQLTTQIRYNTAGSLEAGYVLSANHTPLSAIIYTHNYLNQFTQISDSLSPSLSRTYRYDRSGRIITEKSSEKIDSLAYDPSGNLTFANAATRKYNNYQVENAQNAQNQGFSVKYDASGNATHKTLFNASDSTQYQYSFNAWNLLDSVWNKQTLIYTFLYDYTGNRIQKNNHVTGVTTYYISGNYIYENAASGVSTEKIIAGDQGMYAIWKNENGVNTPIYYHTNPLSNTQFTTNAAGVKASVCSYTPYGAPQLREGEMPRFLFNGKELDSLSQLYYFQSRYYDFSTSRFLTADDRLGGKLMDSDALNRYAFSRNNPISLADFSGHEGDLVVEGATILAATIIEGVVAVASGGTAVPEEAALDADVILLEGGEEVALSDLDFSSNVGIEDDDLVSARGSRGRSASGDDEFLEEGNYRDESGCVRRSTRNRRATQRYEPYNYNDAPKRAYNRTPKDEINGQKRVAENKRRNLFSEAARKPRPYADLDTKYNYFNVGSYKEFTPKQKLIILRENMMRNGGMLMDDITGQRLLLPKKCVSGVKPSYFEAQIDHFYPFKHGGRNSFKNAIVTSRYMNGWKSDKLILGVKNL